MSIRIVTHCYAEVHREYADLLATQLASLHLYDPGVMVNVTVCWTPGDRLVKDVVKFYTKLLKGRVEISSVLMRRETLWRRAIGRNVAATSSIEDIVWFTDADHFFGPLSLATLHGQWNRHGRPEFFWPSAINIHSTKELGDEFLKYASSQSLETMSRTLPKFEHFYPMPMPRAIGGCHIVHGEIARRDGYLGDMPRWLMPESRPFPSFRDDVKFRKHAEKNLRVAKLDLPGIYRIRHTVEGYGSETRAPSQM